MRTREDAEQEEAEKTQMRKRESKTPSVPSHFRDTSVFLVDLPVECPLQGSTMSPIPTPGKWPPTTGILARDITPPLWMENSPSPPAHSSPEVQREEDRSHLGEG